MRTYSNKDQINLGRKAGTEILKAIKNAKKSVKIVSPYLSPSYLEELLKLRKKGVQITLITSDNLEEGNNSFSSFQHSDVIKQGKMIIDKKAANKKKRGIIFSAAILLISFLSLLLLPVLYLSLFLMAIGALAFIFYLLKKTYTYEYYSIFKLKVFDSKSAEKPWSTNLIHSKVFLIDNQILFLGSANFTYSAFNTHYETVIRVEDFKAIDDVSKEIENLFNSTELKSKSIQEWGEEIYE